MRATFRAAEEIVDDTLIIGRGFNGPRLSGNGGYVGGVLAGRFTRAFGGDGTVEITLRAPIPVETSLRVTCDADSLLLHDGATLLCEARAGTVDHLEPPPPPTDWAEVMRRGEEGGSPEDSDFHWCIVCGRGRAVGDGLRVFGTHGPGPGRSLSCYVPHAAHADGEGRIRPEFLWGALDCPGAWAAQDPDDWRPALTGRMTAKVLEPPKVGERCAVVGWRIGAEGRKLYSGTALYTEQGRLCAIGHCTWIVLRS
ncbi:MAG: hypothetical protein A3D94_01020 [Alphaproteobacteria bacterium RIFCSPHIGHO2_12_FULL_66_14]|nr:MAG: hypothetical protein A3D94_01020 [Alphaproteobacteria bacterium RIFCSPHIGHO2_12_FULL_66_14]